MTSKKLKKDNNHSVSPSSQSENLIIYGENKAVLRELVCDYSNTIKCIYIDPPYNNGETYYYYSDNEENKSWLNNVVETLILLRSLLSEDGSIWISIDDKEMHYLKVAADEVFGRSNFLTTIIWEHRKSRENRTLFSNNHEYILAYAKNINEFKKIRKTLPLDETILKGKYKNPDNDPRGPWQSVTANVQDGHAVPSQYYYVSSPSGKQHYPPKGRCWIYNQMRMNEEIANNNIWFGANGLGVPRVKKFLKDSRQGLTPETLWLGKDVGTTQCAKKHIMELFPENKIFETPKPEELIHRILTLATNEGDRILDCYLGSGSTISTAHKMNRSYIGIEQGEHIIELVVERMKKVILGEKGGISKIVNWIGGGDFDFYVFKEK